MDKLDYLIHEVALAIYTVYYLDKHSSEWDTLELCERMTDPAYIRGRFDAHQGIPSYDLLLKQAEAAIRVTREAAEASTIKP
jgi:hypothetical protein